MRCAHHLREVNNDGFPCFSLNEDIEFVIIAMDQARLRESNNDVHQIRVQFARVWDIRYLATTLPKKKKKKKIKSGSAKEKKKNVLYEQGIRIHKLHQHAMSHLINRTRNRKLVLVQDLEEQIIIIEGWSFTDQNDWRAFINAHSFCAANRDMYIHDADLRFPR